MSPLCRTIARLVIVVLAVLLGVPRLASADSMKGGSPYGAAAAKGAAAGHFGVGTARAAAGYTPVHFGKAATGRSEDAKAVSSTKAPTASKNKSGAATPPAMAPTALVGPTHETEAAVTHLRVGGTITTEAPGHRPPLPPRGPPSAPLPGAERVTQVEHIAFGLQRVGQRNGQPNQVVAFANKIGAQTFWNLNNRVDFLTTIHSAMRTAKVISFNLEGFDMARFHTYASSEGAGTNYSGANITNWELYTVLSHPELKAKATFYGPGGKHVPAPTLHANGE